MDTTFSTTCAKNIFISIRFVIRRWYNLFQRRYAIKPPFSVKAIEPCMVANTLRKTFSLILFLFPSTFTLVQLVLALYGLLCVYRYISRQMKKLVNIGKSPSLTCLISFRNCNCSVQKVWLFRLLKQVIRKLLFTSRKI